VAANYATQRLWVLLAVAVGVLFCASPLAVARTITVGRSGCDYTGVRQAVNASRRGDTVLVRPGTYVGTVTLKSGVTVLADDGGDCVLCCGTDAVVTAQDVSSGTLSGFTIEYIGTDGHSAITLYDSSVEISDNVIRGATYRGVYLTGTSNPLIERNIICNNGQSGIRVAGVAQATVRDNEIRGNGRSGIRIVDNANLTAEGNTVCNNTYDGIWVRNDASATLTNNRIHNNGCSGILVSNSADPPHRR